MTEDNDRTELLQTIETFLKPIIAGLVPAPVSEGPGRPRILPAAALWAGVLVAVARGFNAQLDLWRLLAGSGLWDFPRFAVSDDAVYKRLKQAGRETFQGLFRQVTAVLRGQSRPVANSLGRLAAFANGVYALDGMTLDAVTKRLPALRPRAETAILPGKVAAVFDVRAQLWQKVEFVEDAQANDKVAARGLLAGLEVGSLILADLGYFAFAWFDDLTRQGYFWISRLRAKTSYELIHVFYQRDGVTGPRFCTGVDALVWLGADRADRAAYAVRLVQFTRGDKTWAYLTNVLDPRRLSLHDISHLYARRWDIERMFNLVKTHLHLHLLWSSHLTVILHQVYAVFTVAQIILGLQAEIAERAQAEIEEVSLDLMIRWIPRFAQTGQDPIQLIAERGRQAKIIRPIHRTKHILPELSWHDYLPAPDNLLLSRSPRYAGKD